MNRYADVILPLPLDRTFTYSIPPELEVKTQLGVRVLVPFGSRMLTGFVVGLRRKTPEAGVTIKPLTEILDDRPTLSPSFLSFCRKLSRYYLVPLGDILPSAVPPSLLLRSRALFGLTERGHRALERGELAEEEKRIASRLLQKPRSLRFLARNCRVEGIDSLLDRMEKKNLISSRQEMKRVRRREKREEKEKKPFQLELDFSMDLRLKDVAASILNPLRERKFAPFMLFAEPEKRESVYIQLIKEVLSLDGKVIYLIPEIALTPGVISRLKNQLGESLTVLHSRMTERQRELEWERARQAGPLILVGTRSALFSPAQDVRLIICDEEHDDSYSQKEGVPFDLRKAAEMRAEEEKAVLIFGSDMPTVEMFFRARKKRYLIDLLAAPRVPRAVIIPRRTDAGFLSSRLEQAIRARLEKKEPILLFFNRRGYASSLACTKCGFVPHCPRCDLAFSYSKRETKFICRYCGNSAPATGTCPRCRGRLMISRGRGVEALAEELNQRFPASRVAVFSGDEAGRKEQRERILSLFARGEIDILVGTQFLVHQADLPPVRLVGVLYPEMILHLADFRSGQKAFQAIRRAFRFLRPGEDSEVLIQTAEPEHFSLRLAAQGDYLAFYRQEIQFRRLLDYPPFSFLAEVVFSGLRLRRVAEAARRFAARLREEGRQIKVFGPSLAPVSKIRGRHRVVVILKAKSKKYLDAALGVSSPRAGIKRTLLFFE